jgi:hypothetical protein
VPVTPAPSLLASPLPACPAAAVPDTTVSSTAPPPVPPADLAAWTQRDLGWEELVAEASRLGPDPALTALDDGQLEAGVCDLAGQLAALTCRWLGLVAEAVVRGLWADQGAATPAAWLSWRVGLAPSTAREHVRVALRLRELPRIRSAFADGRLSYSKVRALTRFAVPQLEELLLAWADAATASELDRIARGFRTGRRAEATGDEVIDRYRWDERISGDGTMTLTIALPVEEGMELRDRLERRLQVARSRGPAGDGAPAEADDGLSGAPAEADDGPSGAPAEADDEPPETLHRSSPADLVEELVALVLCADPASLADTSGLDRHTLVLQARAAELGAAGGPGGPAGQVAVRDDRGRIRTMHAATLRRLACEAGIVLAVVDDDGTPLDLGRRRRRLSAALRRAVHLRDRGRCSFPGCDETRHLHAHHVQHWSDGGPTDLRNLVLVCARHHRVVHDGAWRIEVRRDGHHRFTPPGRTPLPRCGATVGRAQGPGDRPGPLEAMAAPGPRPVDGLTPTHWAGPRTIDLDLVLAVLHQEFGRLAPDVVAAA